MDSLQTQQSRGLRQDAYRRLWASHPEALRRFDALQTRLGHSFNDPCFLYEALTHRSAVMELGAEPFAADLPWNERLEFLGDSVLGLAVTRRLMLRSEELAEGELSRIRAAVVNEESLAGAARRMELGPALVMGRGAARSGARARDSLLADALEALIGAVFMDGGFEAADAFVGRIFDLVLADDPLLLVQTDFKTMLQEITQDRLKVTPRYEVAGESGPDHDKMFEVKVLLGDQEMGRGLGASKKRASQAAAQRALERLVGKEREL